MMRFILSAALVFGMSSFAVAGELDNESGVTNKELQGTMVLRVDTRTGEATYIQTEAAMGSEADAKAFAQKAEFSPVPVSNMKSELDADGGASSWYFYNPYPRYGYYNPYCNWYGNYYNPYYQYNNGYYNYYYYGSCWSYCR
ncbi:hypothetical protein [Bdellovibrio sp. HCB337]|uniref:hypothetical protein n=1 Tax=Bdellovibrio sp. HCB337 TaxID=3394358 RepID=UPI0039A5B2E9